MVIEGVDVLPVVVGAVVWCEQRDGRHVTVIGFSPRRDSNFALMHDAETGPMARRSMLHHVGVAAA
jgi:hypothetical protein